MNFENKLTNNKKEKTSANIEDKSKKELKSTHKPNNQEDILTFCKVESRKKDLEKIEQLGKKSGMDLSRTMKEIRGEIGTGEARNEKYIFDPEAELSDIKQRPKEERKTKLNEFKEKLIYQKRGIAEIQSFLVDSIQKNPSQSIEQLKQSVQSLEEKYWLSDKQKEAFQKGLELYEKKHLAIQEHTQNFIKQDGSIDSPGLYEKFFNKKPEGRIEVVISPVSIYFRLENFNDYLYIYSDAYRGDKIDKAERNRARMSDGFYLNSFPVEKLKEAIIVENSSEGDFEKKADRKNTMIHEEQHVINSIIGEAYNAEETNENSLRREHDELKYRLGEHLFEYDDLRPDYKEDIRIERDIKDEIIAYLKGGNNIKEIEKILLKKNTLYDYGFDYRKALEFKNKKEKPSKEYICLIKNSLLAYDGLLRNGYLDTDAQNLLVNEALSSWPKVVERIIGKKNTKNMGISERIRREVAVLDEWEKTEVEKGEGEKRLFQEQIKNTKNLSELEGILSKISHSSLGLDGYQIIFDLRGKIRKFRNNKEEFIEGIKNELLTGLYKREDYGIKAKIIEFIEKNQLDYNQDIYFLNEKGEKMYEPLEIQL